MGLFKNRWWSRCQPSHALKYLIVPLIIGKLFKINALKTVFKQTWKYLQIKIIIIRIYRNKEKTKLDFYPIWKVGLFDVHSMKVCILQVVFKTSMRVYLSLPWETELMFSNYLLALLMNLHNFTVRQMAHLILKIQTAIK